VTRLVLIPGLGTDARLFEVQRTAFPHLETPAWIEPRRREPLAAYARRLAASIDPSTPMVLGGVSLGGMLALEMARHLPVRRLALIGSCRSPAAVRPWLFHAERASRPWPTWLLARMTVISPLVVGLGGTIPEDSRRLLVRMTQEVPMSFIRWGGRAILSWPGCPDPGVPVSHIHGGRDWVLPLRRGVAATRIVDQGSHVLNLSHPAEVNDFLRDELQAAERDDGER
jgi:pimeloyl-ACP methyl ester carboxylesterase